MARGKSSGNFSFSRASALADIEAQQAKEKAEARQAEVEAKNQRTEAWNAEADQLKQLAQNVLDGTASAKDYADEIDNAKTKFADKAGLLETNLRSVIRAADTQRFNDYVSGATSFDDFKSYSDDRAKDASGDQEHLAQLLSKAQKNEDTVQYNSYVKGETSIDDWNKYVNSRSSDKSPGNDATNVVSIHLATLDAQAQANEARANDKRYQTAYQAGVLPGDQYQKYLDTRISGATNPNDLNALRIEKQTVVKNEFVKGVNDILDQQQSGRISAGEAALRLHGMLSQTNDATLQGQVLNHIASLQKEVGAAGASVASSLRAKQTEVNSNYTAAQTEFNSTMTKIATSAGKGSDPGQILNQAAIAWNNFALEIDNAARNSTDIGPGSKQEFYQSRLAHLDQERSTSISDLLQTSAQAIGELTGKNQNPIAGAAKRAEILLRGLASPYINGPDKKTIYSQADQLVAETKKGWAMSEEGRQADSFTKDVALSIQENPDGAVHKDLQALATQYGLGTIDFTNRASIAAAVRELNFADSTAVWKVLHDDNLPGFTAASSDEYHTADSYTSSWNARTGGAVGLRDLSNTIYGNQDNAGLSLKDRAWTEAFIPDALGWLERNITSVGNPSSKSNVMTPSQAHMLATDTGGYQSPESFTTNVATPDALDRNAGVAEADPATSPGVSGQQQIGNVPHAPPLYGNFPGQDAEVAGMHPAQGPEIASPDAQDRNAATQEIQQTQPAEDLQFQIDPTEVGMAPQQELIQEPLAPQSTPIVPMRDSITNTTEQDLGAQTVQADLPDQDIPEQEPPSGGGGRRE